MKSRPKSTGQSIMVSAFVDPVSGGILEHEGKVSFHHFEAGQGEWWTSAKMCKQLEEVTSCFELFNYLCGGNFVV